MKNSRQLKMVKCMQAKAEWKARIKALDIDGCRPYVVGDPDPITGRPQGPNVDLMTPDERKAQGVLVGVTNARHRKAVREIMTHFGLPPVGHFWELTQEERKRYFDMRDQRDRLDLPCFWLEFTPEQLKQCAEWHEKVERGEMTREEYHRLARALVGLPEEEASSSGDSAGSGAAESPASPTRKEACTSS